jgi:WD40 repeat protein
MLAQSAMTADIVWQSPDMFVFLLTFLKPTEWMKLQVMNRWWTNALGSTTSARYLWNPIFSLYGLPSTSKENLYKSMQFNHRLLKKNVSHKSVQHGFDVWSVDLQYPLLASGSMDHTVCLWDLDSLEEQKPLVVFREPTKAVGAVRFVGESLLVVGSDDLKLRFWNTKDRVYLGEMTGHTGYVWDVNCEHWLTHDFVSAGGDGTIKQWDINHRACLQTLGSEKMQIAYSVAKHGSMVAGGYSTNICCLWDLRNAECIHTFRKHEARVKTVLLKDNKELLTAGPDKALHRWDLRTLSCIESMCTRSGVTCGLRHGELVIVGCEDARVRIFNLGTRSLEPKRTHEVAFTEGSSIIRSVTISGNHLAVAGENGVIRVFL